MKSLNENSDKLFTERLSKQKEGHYIALEPYKGIKTKILFKHVDCGYNWYTTPNTLFNSKDRVLGGCPRCQYDEKRIGKAEFEKRMNEKFHGEYVLSGNPEYTGTNKKAGFTHAKCGTHFTIVANSIMVNDTSCPECREPMGMKPISREEFEDRLFDKWHGEYILADDSPYTKLLDDVTIIHTTCGTRWTTRANHILCDSGCPNCNQSHGEIFINHVLRENNASFECQYKIPECRNYRELPFDFALTSETGKLIGLIEYDGSQHFQSFDHFGGDKKFKRQQENDLIKTNFCDSHSIPLLRVNYKDSWESVRKQVISFSNKVHKK